MPKDETIESLREMIEHIKTKEEENYNTKLDIAGLTKKEYLKKVLSEKKLSLDTLFDILTIKDTGVMYLESDIAYIFIRKPKKIPFLTKINNITEELDVVDTIITTYHEIRHIIQNKHKELFNSYEKFCINLCQVRLLVKGYKEYISNHNGFYHEIDANVYGIKMFENIANKNEKLHQTFEKYIKMFKGLYEFDSNNFDFDKFFSLYDKGIKLQLINPSKEEQETFPFWDNNYNLKSPKEIIKIKKLKNIEAKLIVSIMASSAYLENQNFDSLTLEEKNILLEILYKRIIELIEIQEKNEIYLKNNIITDDENEVAKELIQLRVEEKEKYLRKLSKPNIKVRK